MLKLKESPSLPIEGMLIFDVFSIRLGEPFLVMYGFSAGYGYQLPEWQTKLVYRNMHSRAIFERWREIGAECKAGKRPLPSWVQDTTVRP